MQPKFAKKIFLILTLSSGYNGMVKNPISRNCPFNLQIMFRGFFFLVRCALLNGAQVIRCAIGIGAL
jgi:hypothetical protein